MMKIKDIIFNVCVRVWYISEKILDSVFLSWLFSSFVIFLIVLGGDEDIWAKIIGSMFFGIGGMFITIFLLFFVSSICEKISYLFWSDEEKREVIKKYSDKLHQKSNWQVDYSNKEIKAIERAAMYAGEKGYSKTIDYAKKIDTSNNDFDELKKVAIFIAKYRKDMLDIDKRIDLYYWDLNSINKAVFESILKIIEIINSNLAEAFYNEYSCADEMILKVEPILDEILNETNKLKGILKNLDDDEIKIYYKMIIQKFLSELDVFFIKLENLLLNGGSGEIKLNVDLENEIKALKNELEKQNKNTSDLSGFILGLGLGLGYMIGSD